MRRSKRLTEKKLQSLGKIVTVIAHELKSPISGIISLSNILLGREGMDPKVYEYISLIHKGAVECDRLIKNIFSYVREPALPDFKKVNINDLIGKWIEFIYKSYGQNNSGITIEKRLQTDMEYIEIDELQIKEVFTNIFLNAVEAVKDVPNPMIIIETKQDEEYTYIIITDNGQGIPKENIDSVFTPFFSTKEKGVGLGLSITRDIVEKHGGNIALDSEKNKGTKVTVKLPLHR